ncbi:DUF1810 family protein [Erythrobacter litoralis]|uniref:DUF1810 domain-containing protein n=1 Tax=Erythrobacter litoralis TaxID=39960 RepID=UPI002434B740|nr:DUF1810 domain-containing protein [Erythrobacter litoralis]MDG6078909.1 DUF1810 family protein [Erythrobacter litoralis]
MAETFDFDRFLAAQDGGVFEKAIEELQQGEKRSHWMWFVFPQLEGLGSSPTARKYALSGIAEAGSYAAHEELGPRLIEASEAMLEWAGTMPAHDILGQVDAIKFRSSMTLFEAACEDDQVFADALDAFYDGERCARTLDAIQSSGKVNA